ncbi:hypothetical protein [Nostoc sp.]|uniref:hypothetical protein n=1 Tax=Nostoc sp. TaxID=1180 RepID=UPI002FFAB1C9
MSTHDLIWQMRSLGTGEKRRITPNSCTDAINRVSNSQLLTPNSSLPIAQI